jgi:hypothetical protein
LDEIQEETSPGVAAAASTLIYAKAYGGSGDNAESDEYDEEGSPGSAPAATKLLNNEKGEEEEYDEEGSVEVADLSD